VLLGVEWVSPYYLGYLPDSDADTAAATAAAAAASRNTFPPTPRLSNVQVVNSQYTRFVFCFFHHLEVHRLFGRSVSTSSLEFGVA
jgi:hypothetical protein